ncbi:MULTISPECIES: hypothetical protein [unclassified Microcystis]|nr:MULTISPECIES: hypothetical protein [unclassified Microcystis]
MINHDPFGDRKLERLQLMLSKIWVKTPSFEDGFKLKWKKR